MTPKPGIGAAHQPQDGDHQRPDAADVDQEDRRRRQHVAAVAEVLDDEAVETVVVVLLVLVEHVDGQREEGEHGRPVPAAEQQRRQREQHQPGEKAAVDPVRLQASEPGHAAPPNSAARIISVVAAKPTSQMTERQGTRPKA